MIRYLILDIEMYLKHVLHLHIPPGAPVQLNLTISPPWTPSYSYTYFFPFLLYYFSCNLLDSRSSWQEWKHCIQPSILVPPLSWVTRAQSHWKLASENHCQAKLSHSFLAYQRTIVKGPPWFDWDHNDLNIPEILCELKGIFWDTYNYLGQWGKKWKLMYLSNISKLLEDASDSGDGKYLYQFWEDLAASRKF